MQTLMDPPGAVRNDNEDDELLDRAEHLANLVGERLVLAVRDLSMDPKARLRRLDSVYLVEGS